MPKALETESSLFADPTPRGPGIARSRHSSVVSAGTAPAKSHHTGNSSPAVGSPRISPAKWNHHTGTSSPALASPRISPARRNHHTGTSLPAAGSPRIHSRATGNHSTLRQEDGQQSPERGHRHHRSETNHQSETAHHHSQDHRPSGIELKMQSLEMNAMKRFDSRWAVLPASPQSAKSRRRPRNLDLLRSLAADSLAGLPPLPPSEQEEEIQPPILLISRHFDTPGATRLDRWRYRVRIDRGRGGSPQRSISPIRRTRPAVPPGGWGTTRLERWRQRVVYGIEGSSLAPVLPGARRKARNVSINHTGEVFYRQSPGGERRMSHEGSIEGSREGSPAGSPCRLHPGPEKI